MELNPYNFADPTLNAAWKHLQYVIRQNHQQAIVLPEGGGGGGGLTVEEIQDMISTFIDAGTGLTKSYDDAGNLLELAATGGGGGSGSVFSRVWGLGT